MPKSHGQTDDPLPLLCGVGVRKPKQDVLTAKMIREATKKIRRHDESLDWYLPIKNKPLFEQLRAVGLIELVEVGENQFAWKLVERP